MRTVLVALAAMVSVTGGCRSQTSEPPNGSPTASPPGSSESNREPGATPSGSSPPAAQGDGSPSGEPAPPPSTKVDLTTGSVEVFGQARTFLLATPKGYDAARSYPLAMVFHGDGGSGAGMRASYPLDEYSGQDAIIVYPDGKGGWDLYTPEAQNEDDIFVVAIVDALKARFNVDPSRVLGVGYSSGAFFIQQVACRKSGFFRGIVANSGGAPNEPNDPAATFWKGDYTKCANQTVGVAAMIVHGTDDRVVLPESGDFSAQYWAYVNGCDDRSDTRVATSPPPCLAHVACPADKPVHYCPIPNIGHGMWSESAKEAWAFLSGL